MEEVVERARVQELSRTQDQSMCHNMTSAALLEMIRDSSQLPKAIQMAEQAKKCW